MPFTRVYVKEETSSNRKKAITKGIHRALVESINIPEDDFFQLILTYNPADFF